MTGGKSISLCRNGDEPAAWRMKTAFMLSQALSNIRDGVIMNDLLRQHVITKRRRYQAA